MHARGVRGARLTAAVVACSVFGTLVAGAAGPARSTRDVLAGEAARLLPAEARILSGEYRERCLEFLAGTPPCLALRFKLSGPAEHRKTRVLARARGRWQVEQARSPDGWTLRLHRGGLRAVAFVASREYRERCHGRLVARVLGPLNCEDSLLLELGPPASVPTLEVRLPPTSLLENP